MRKKALIMSTGEQEKEKPRISVFDYDASQYSESEIGLDECVAYKEKPTVTWINVDGVHDRKVIQKIGECYGLNDLVQEQIMNTDLRPRIEDHGEFLFIVLKMFLYNKETSAVVSEQVSMVVGEHYVMTFQESLREDVFDSVRKRIRTAGTKIRQSKTDYLVYRLIDAVVDYYFAIMEIMGERIEVVEEETVASADRKTLVQMQKIRKDMIYLRKSIWPVREILNSMQRGESRLISPEVQRFMRDLYEHTVQVIDTIETLRDTMSSLLDIYLSSISNRLNEVMKVLTIISTIFMPLTFLVGVYGMNFRYMPEIEWKYGYYSLWLVILVIVAAMLFLFRRRKWI
jgi:magnesium transporter